MSTPEIETAPAIALELRIAACNCTSIGDAARMRIAAGMIAKLYSLVMTLAEQAERDAPESNHG